MRASTAGGGRRPGGSQWGGATAQGKIKGGGGRGGKACSPPRQQFGDGLGDGEVTVAEIEAAAAAGSEIGRSSMLC
jgi:hypothetical protein